MPKHEEDSPQVHAALQVLSDLFHTKLRIMSVDTDGKGSMTIGLYVGSHLVAMRVKET